MRRTSPVRLRAVFAVLFVALVWLGCTDSRDLTAPDDLGPNIRIVDQVALDHAIRVQEAHTDGLMDLEQVAGTAVGLSESGRPIVRVYLMRDEVGGIPVNVDGVSFVPDLTGPIVALVQNQRRCATPPCGKGNGGDDEGDATVDPTAKFDRPVPIGVSTGHPDITAGTIGALVLRVVDGSNVYYALSANHVYADEGRADIGDAVIQPGTFDGGSSPNDDIGTLSAFVPIVFSRTAGNKADAAIALTTLLGNSTPADGYGTPRSMTTSASLNLRVMKYGRTTGQTRGKVNGINATILVGYGNNRVALFVDQIEIKGGNFSAGGDSGSLIVVEGGANDRKPVALLFAGGRGSTFANPIEGVLTGLNVTIDGN